MIFPVMPLLAKLERLIFAKLELWVVLLILTLGLLGMVLFGAAVKYHAEGRRGAGIIGETAFRIASLPEDVLNILGATTIGSPYLATESDFVGNGLDNSSGHSDGAEGYLLLSRHDADANQNLVELVDLERGETLHVWQPDFDAIADRVVADSGRTIDRRGWTTSHAWPDGSLAFLGLDRDGYMATVDRCSSLEWVISTPHVHHSIEADADEYLWAPYDLTSPSVPAVQEGFQDQGLAKISRSGEVVSLIPFGDVLRRNGYRSLMYMMDSFLQDPLHMNDIQPVPEDGPYWKRGDLFISLRTHSVVLLYRPETDEILWFQNAPWLHQHDVNLLNDHEISIFSNDSIRFEGGPYRVLGANDVYIHDFETGETRSPWREALRLHDVRTATQGRATVIGDNDLFVEETNRGRALRLSTDGSLHWTYVNRASDGEVYQLAWSRYLTAEEGAEIAQAVTAPGCP